MKREVGSIFTAQAARSPAQGAPAIPQAGKPVLPIIPTIPVVARPTIADALVKAAPTQDFNLARDLALFARVRAAGGRRVAAIFVASSAVTIVKQSLRLPSELYRSLTWDRGKELADHQRLTLATEVEVYFCDPRSPWQCGSNENTNRLLRQYLPRGTNLSLHSQAKLSAIARQLNERPRKTLLYQTPAEKFAECVAAIG